MFMASDIEVPENKNVPVVAEEKLPVPAAQQPDAAAADAKSRSQKKSAPAKAAKKDEPIPQEKQLLFEKYDVSNLTVEDQSLFNYIKMSHKAYPNMFGRRKYHAYYVTHMDIVERLISKLMRGGTGRKISGSVIRRKGALQGKKLKVTHIMEQAFEMIQKKTNKNPVQVLVEALQNAAPIEDTTRVRYGGISYNVAVGISSQRRLDVALRHMALAGLMSSFKNKKTLAEALANEIMLAASNSPDSYAVKKRVEAERIAKRAR